MDQRSRRVLSQLSQKSPFAEFFAHGFEPQDLKQAVIELFEPYFENRQALEYSASNYLTGQMLVLMPVLDDQWATDLLGESLRIHREALQRNAGGSLQATTAHMEGINKSLSHFWSAYHRAADLGAIEELEEFAYESLRLAGTMIEAVIKPYLYELSHQIKTESTGTPSTNDILQDSLGSVVQTIIASSSANTLSVHGIPVHQWRNIAQHFSTQCQAGIIHCTYGSKNQHSIDVTRAEMMASLAQIYNGYRALMAAHTIFFFDNLDTIKQLGLLPALQNPIRPEALLLATTSAVSAQGFLVTDIHQDGEVLAVTIQDLTTADANTRFVHASQFLVTFYQIYPATSIIVEYHDSNGTPRFRAKADGSLIEEAVAERNISIVAKSMDIEAL